MLLMRLGWGGDPARDVCCNTRFGCVDFFSSWSVKDTVVVGWSVMPLIEKTSKTLWTTP
jgi:hypothetical protein